MILSELNKLLVNVARSNYLVNDAFVGDVYTINGKENKFGCFVATPMTATKTTIGTIRYNYYLYYIDRLTKDEVNIDFVQSDAVSVLKGIINFINDNGIEVDGYEFTLFRQKFSDWCAGAYVNVTFMVSDNECGEGDFNTEGVDLRPLVVDRNGIYEPGTFDGYNRVTINVPQVGATEQWVDNEIDLKLNGYATEEWVSSQTSDFVKFTHNDPLGIGTAIMTEDGIFIGTSTRLGTEIGFGFKYTSEVDRFTVGIFDGNTFWAIATRWDVDEQIRIGLSEYETFSDTKTWVQNQGYIKSISSDYATKNWVETQGYLTSIPSTLASKTWVNNQGFLKAGALSDYVTSDWVVNQGYITSVPASYATKTYVNNQGFLKEDDLEDYALKSYVDNLDYLTEDDLGDYATKSWVNNQGFITEVNMDDYASKNWVENQGYITEVNMDDYASKTWVENQEYISSGEIEDMATKTWVRQQGYLTGSNLTGYATKTWVGLQGFITEDDLCGYATEEWVNQQGFLIEDDLCGYATEEWTRNWVDNQGFLKECDLNDYATMNWIENQGYLTETDLSQYVDKDWIEEYYASKEWVLNKDYATESWVNEHYLADLSEYIWSGYQDEWDRLSVQEKCSYLIAMIKN